MTNTNTSTQLMDIATRIRGMREILGYSTQKLATPYYVTYEYSEELPKTISGKIQRNKL